MFLTEVGMAGDLGGRVICLTGLSHALRNLEHSAHGVLNGTVARTTQSTPHLCGCPRVVLIYILSLTSKLSLREGFAVLHTSTYPIRGKSGVGIKMSTSLVQLAC